MQQDVEVTSDVRTQSWALLVSSLEVGPHYVVQAGLNVLYSSDVHLHLLSSWSHFVQLHLGVCVFIYLFQNLTMYHWLASTSLYVD